MLFAAPLFRFLPRCQGRGRAAWQGDKKEKMSIDDGVLTQTWEAAGSKPRWMLRVIPPFLADALLGCLPGGCGLYRRLTGDDTSPRANGANPILPKFLLIGGRLAWPIHHHHGYMAMWQVDIKVSKLQNFKFRNV